MAQLVVRRLEEIVKRRLQARAKKNGRSMEEEARAILREAVGARARTGTAKKAGPVTRAARRPSRGN